jgi:2-hydroxy-3-keto-5-methylthiopentenyl-1-phosphate phosphatase
MIDSISVPFPDCIDLARRHIPLDPYFNDFFRWTRANHIPVIVLSSGMRPIIHALLVDLIGPEANQIPIICNGVADLPPKTKEQPGGWTIRFHDETDFGHDKSLTIRPYRKHFDERPGEKRPVMLFAGDGVSDLSAARETDRLFAKKGRGEHPRRCCGHSAPLIRPDLVTYCEREGVPFTRFGNWNDILEETKAIL